MWPSPKQIACPRRQKVPESQTAWGRRYAFASPQGKLRLSFFGFLFLLDGRGLAIFPHLGIADTNLSYPKLDKYFSFCEGRSKFKRVSLLSFPAQFWLVYF
jgi:hypothetical protein